MDFYTDIKTYIIRTQNLQALPINGISPLDENESDVEVFFESGETVYKDGKKINAPKHNIACAICLYGTKNMIHGWRYSSGIYENTSEPMPPNHLNHNRPPERIQSGARGPFTFPEGTTNVKYDALVGKLLMSVSLDNPDGPPTWCEVATIADIPPPLPVYINYDIDTILDYTSGESEESVESEEFEYPDVSKEWY